MCKECEAENNSLHKKLEEVKVALKEIEEAGLMGFDFQCAVIASETLNSLLQGEHKFQ